jgi:hypothetical protein
MNIIKMMKTKKSCPTEKGQKHKEVVSPGLRISTLMLLSVLCFAACKKTDITEPETVVPEPQTTVAYNKLLRVENLVAILENNTTTAAPTVYFSLETKASVPESYGKTNRWDVAFGGLYNSFISGNNGSVAANYGYGTSGKGGVLILEKAFSEVTDVPADALFKTGKDVIGTDDAGDYGVGTGWYLYDFNGLKVGDGSYDKQHVAYALSEELTLKSGTVIKPRTIVVKTAKGNYAKIKMISCYQNAYTIAQWSRDVPHMYFTFEYVLVPAGSTKFEIK